MQFINRDKVLYGAATLMGLVTVLYFGFEYLANLSPASISIILFALFGGLLAGGLNRSGNTESLLYILSVGTYIVWLSYTMNAFSWGENLTQLSLLVSTGLFIGLAYIVTQKDYTIDFDRLKQITVVLTVFVILLGVFDAQTDNLSVEFELDSETVNFSDEMDVGELDVEKPGFLPREREFFSVNACLYNSTGQRQPVSGFRAEQELLGFGSRQKTRQVTIESPEEDVEGLEQGEELPIVRNEECPRERSSKALYLVYGEPGETEFPVY